MLSFGSGTALLHQLFFIIAGIAGISFLIAIHELGHFLFAKLFRVSTPSFSIGFGPRIFEKKIGDTTFALSAIPLGGYVEMAGAAEVGQGEQAEAQRQDKYSFAKKPYYQKLLIMIGGILFNLLFAYGTLVLLFSLGIPKTPLLYPKNAIPVITKVLDNSPAAQARIQAGDEVIAFDNTPITSVEQLLELQAKKAATLSLEKQAYALPLVIKRNQQEQTIPVTFSHDNPVTGSSLRLGVLFESLPLAPLSFGQAIKEGIAFTNHLIKQTIGGFASLTRWKALDNLGGPLMVISQTVKGAESGIKIFLILLALISVNLAVLNLIPLPILDGGQILFYTIEAIIGRPLPEQAKLYIHYASWVLILALIIFLSVKDFSRIVSSFYSR